MPELPEVETIVRGLRGVIVGKKITHFEKRDPKIIKLKPEEINSSEIREIERHAKIIEFKLSNKKTLLIHLKMTGQLIWEEEPGTTAFELKKSRPSTELRAATQRVAGGHPSPDWVAKLPNAYTRAIFHFDDGSVLFFNDLRRFGYIKIFDTALEGKLPELQKLGPEPIRFTGARSHSSLSLRAHPSESKTGQVDEEFTIDYLVKMAKRFPNRKIKQFITDQKIISGVGNIYVDEALFYSGIMPTRLVKDIKLSEWKIIRDNIRKALELGIKYGGSSEDTYVDAFGNQGTFNDHTQVYRHTGEPCPKGCGGKVERITVGGRGTHFCRSCQT